MITFDQIKDSQPILLIYQSGCGGEHIATVLSTCSPSIIPLMYRENIHTASISATCVIDYSANWSDVDEPDTWLNGLYLQNNQDGRHLIKDHPIEQTRLGYHKFMPDVNVVFLAPVEQIDYYANLAVAKLARRITTPVDSRFIEDNIFKGSSTVISKILEIANGFPELWLHEFFAIKDQVIEGLPVDTFVHQPDIKKIIDDHRQLLNDDLSYTEPLFRSTFHNYLFVDSDCMIDIRFCKYLYHQISKMITDLDIDRAERMSKAWIERNQQILINPIYNI